MTGGRGLLALVGAVVLCGCGTPGRVSEVSSAGGPASGKPCVPVEAGIEMAGGAQAEGPARFRLWFVSGVDSPKASVEIVLPAVASMEEGAASWTGPLRAGEQKLMEFVVTCPGGVSYVVSADIVIAEGRGTVLRKRVVLDVGAGPNKIPVSAAKPSHDHKAVPLEDFLERR